MSLVVVEVLVEFVVEVVMVEVRPGRLRDREGGGYEGVMRG